MFKSKVIGLVAAASLCAVSTQAGAQDAPGAEQATYQDSIQRVLPGARVTMMDFGQAVAKISRIRVSTSGQTPEARANDFLSRHASLMGLDANALQAVRTDVAAGRTVVSYRQMHGEFVVIDRNLTVTMDDAGDVLRVQSDLIPLSQVVRGPVEREVASALATTALWGEMPYAALNAEQVVVSLEDGSAFVAWAVHVPLRPLVDHMVVLVDSRDGQIIEARNRTIIN